MKSFVFAVFAAVTLATPSNAEESWQPFALMNIEGIVVAHPKTGAKVLDGKISLLHGTKVSTYLSYMPLPDDEGTAGSAETSILFFALMAQLLQEGKTYQFSNGELCLKIDDGEKIYKTCFDAAEGEA